MKKGLLWVRLRFVSELGIILGSALVVLGLMLESDWATGWRTLGAAAVIVGVAVETLLDGGILLASHKLEMLHNQELEAMRLETAQANDRAAEANEKAEHERLERMKIEERIAPRTLSAKQWESIASKLRWSRPEREVPVFASKNDAEIMRFANSLGKALQIANWPIVGGVKSYFDRIPIGVWIEYRDIADATDMARANLLVEVLRDEGIEVSGPRAAELGFTASTSGDALNLPVQILIGEKP